MPQKTQGVYDLVNEVLGSIPRPYSEDIVDEICLAIENNPSWLKRYHILADEFGVGIVNNRIGHATSNIAGLKSTGIVKASRSKLFRQHTQFR